MLPAAIVEATRYVLRLHQLAKPVGRVVLRDMMDVDHRRLDVGVAHVCLHVRERERLHRDRPKLWRSEWKLSRFSPARSSAA
jgi:hypothetical protein